MPWTFTTLLAWAKEASSPASFCEISWSTWQVKRCQRHSQTSKELRIKHHQTPHKISELSIWYHQKEFPPPSYLHTFIKRKEGPTFASRSFSACCCWAKEACCALGPSILNLPILPILPILPKAPDCDGLKGLEFLGQSQWSLQEKTTVFGEVVPDKHRGLILQWFVLLASLKTLVVHVWSSF